MMNLLSSMKLLLISLLSVYSSCQTIENVVNSQNHMPLATTFATSLIARDGRMIEARFPSTITVSEHTTITTTIPGETEPTTLTTSTSISLTDNAAVSSYIQTAIPSSVRSESSFGCFVNPQYSYYATPDWYSTLPAEVQSYYSSVNQGNTAACTLAANDPRITSGASSASAQGGSSSGSSGLSTGAKVGIALGAVGAFAALASALFTIFKGGNPCGHGASKGAASGPTDVPPKHSGPNSSIPHNTAPVPSNAPGGHGGHPVPSSGTLPSSPGPSSPPPGYASQPPMSQVPTWDGHAGSQGPPGWNGNAGSQAPPGWDGNAGSQAQPGWNGSAGSQPPPSGWDGTAGSQGPPGWNGTAGSQPPPGWSGWAGADTGPPQAGPNSQSPGFNGEAGSGGQPTNTGLGSQPPGWNGWAGSDAGPGPGQNPGQSYQGGGYGDPGFNGEAGSGTGPTNTGLGSQPPSDWSGAAGGDGNWAGQAGSDGVMPPSGPAGGGGQIPFIPLVGGVYRRDKKESQQRVSSYHSQQSGHVSPAYATPSERPANELSGVSSNSPWTGYSNESVRAEMPGDSPYFHQGDFYGQTPPPRNTQRRTQSSQSIARRPVGSRNSTGRYVQQIDTGSPQPAGTPRPVDQRAIHRHSSYDAPYQPAQYSPYRGPSPMFESASRTIYESGSRTVHESANSDVYEGGSQSVSRSDGSARR